MRPCATCGSTAMTAAGNCQNCGMFRGGEVYGNQPVQAPPAGTHVPGSHVPGTQVPGTQVPPSQPYDPYQQQYGQQPPSPRRPSAVPLIVLSVIAVLLAVGIVGVLVARSGGDDGRDDGRRATGVSSSPGAPSAAKVAAGIDSCVVGSWRVTSATEKVDLEGSLTEFTATGGTVELKGDGTGKIDYGDGVAYRGTVSGQPVTITISGWSTFNYKTVDSSFTFSNTASQGQAVMKINGTTATSIPLEMDTDPTSYRCSGGSMTMSTELTTTELRK